MRGTRLIDTQRSDEEGGSVRSRPAGFAAAVRNGLCPELVAQERIPVPSLGREFQTGLAGRDIGYVRARPVLCDFKRISL
jgi:hypothetical protein